MGFPALDHQKNNYVNVKLASLWIPVALTMCVYVCMYPCMYVCSDGLCLFIVSEIKLQSRTFFMRGTQVQVLEYSVLR